MFLFMHKRYAERRGKRLERITGTTVLENGFSLYILFDNIMWSIKCKCLISCYA
jgi:hypothetical protein